jgi:Domain of unknown function (DUF5076)
MKPIDTKLTELHIPPAVFDDPNAHELLRAWAAQKKVHVSFSSRWKEPGNWGIFLADLARHAARSFAMEGICSEAVAFEQIRDMFEKECDKPTSAVETEEFRKQ